LNTATIDELRLVPGIGPVTADKTYKWYGAFKSVDDLSAIQASARNGSKKCASA
jgi:DNA uptake protein ComE-like DNA-binding protein